MSIPVEIERLREESAQHPLAYLLTTGEDGRPHAVAVSLQWSDDGRLVMAGGRRTRANVAARPTVSLLWPPAEPGGYSLIADGAGALVDGTDNITVTPTKGVLHRPAGTPGAADPAPGCTADCIPVFKTAPA